MDDASILLAQTAALLDNFELCKGEIALGVMKAPKNPGDALKFGHVYPWSKHVYQFKAFSLLGALCYVAKADPSNTLVQQATSRLQAAFDEPKPFSPYAWADQEHITKADVQELLRRAAPVRHAAVSASILTGATWLIVSLVA